MSAKPAVITRDRPMLFSAPMVRANLAGEKTMTRRLVGTDDKSITRIFWAEKSRTLPDGEYTGWVKECGAPLLIPISCPYGAVGDRIWVKETFRLHERESTGKPYSVSYRADDGDGGYRWTPSIFMRRRDSRITLEVTAVRAERLHEITDADARAEGMTAVPQPDFGTKIPSDASLPPVVKLFAMLWDKINGKRAAWSTNPWVWVISYKRVRP